MTTLINVTAGGDDLVARAKIRQQAGRLARAEQERRQALGPEKAKQATDEPQGKGLEALPVRRDLAAFAEPKSYAVWGLNWCAPAQIGYTEYASYRYADAKDIRFQLPGRGTTVSEPIEVLKVPQPSFVVAKAGNGPAESGSSDHGNRPIFYDSTASSGNYYFYFPPVLASNGPVVFGVQRIAYNRINVPWHLTYTTLPNSFVNTYVYFRVDTRSQRVDAKVSTVEPSFPVTAANYREGGTVWAQQYAQNAFPDDPSTTVRSFGYWGDYHVRGGTASFLRFDSTTTAYQKLSSSHSLYGDGGAFVWLTFPIEYSSTAELKAQLEACDLVVPTRTFSKKRALSSRLANDYNTKSRALFDSMLPPPDSEEQYWSFTGPYVHPLIGYS